MPPISVAACRARLALMRDDGQDDSVCNASMANCQQRSRRPCHRRRCATNTSKFACAIRMTLKIRTCGSSPLAHSLYTVAVQTPSWRATAVTENRFLWTPVGPRDSSFCAALWKIRGSCRDVDPNENEDLGRAWSVVNVRKSRGAELPRRRSPVRTRCSASIPSQGPLPDEPSLLAV